MVPDPALEVPYRKAPARYSISSLISVSSSLFSFHFEFLRSNMKVLQATLSILAATGVVVAAPSGSNQGTPHHPRLPLVESVSIKSIGVP